MPLSARLAVWTTAWLEGRAGFDDVLDAMARSGHRHLLVTDGEPEQPLGAALFDWRRAGVSGVRVVLPAAGDARGLPGPLEFGRAAIAAGEAAYGGPLGLVPTADAATASSAAPLVRWHASPIGPPAPDPLSLADATHDLAVAMRETASLFTAGQLSGASSEVSQALSRARRAGEQLDLPPGFPSPATALAAQAERLAEMLDIARADHRGGAVDRQGMGTRDDALRALVGVVRRARQAAYNTALSEAER
jgi:hypothetical protein